MQSVSIIGIGRAGGALALALSKAGYRIDYLVHRNRAIAESIAANISGSPEIVSFDSFPHITSDVILITTADPDIEAVARQLAASLETRPVVLHTSGSLSSDVLADVTAIGCPAGSMHPLVSISDAVSGAGNLSNAFFCLEGNDVAVATADSIVRALGGKPFSIPSKYKPLYHAAAVVACGHLVALIDVAIEMLSKCDMDRETAQRVLFPLIESTIENLKTRTPAEALTGSFARADLAAMERHLNSIESTIPSARDIYMILGERSLELAAANGASPSDVQNMRERIRIAKRKPE